MKLTKDQREILRSVKRLKKQYELLIWELNRDFSYLKKVNQAKDSMGGLILSNKFCSKYIKPEAQKFITENLELNPNELALLVNREKICDACPLIVSGVVTPFCGGLVTEELGVVNQLCYIYFRPMEELDADELQALLAFKTAVKADAIDRKLNTNDFEENDLCEAYIQKAAMPALDAMVLALKMGIKQLLIKYGVAKPRTYDEIKENILKVAKEQGINLE
jgi:hypothetical protein